MEIKLNLEQVSYIKSLDSKKKQRKFLLDCLVESIIGESVKIEDEKCILCRRYPKIKDSNKCESCDFCIKNSLENDPYFIELRSGKISDLPSKTYVRNGDKFYAEGHSFKTNDQISIKSADGKVIKKGVVKKVYLPNEFSVILDGSSWGNMPYCNLIVELEMTDSPSKKTEEINRLNPLYTTTTAPRTFEGNNSNFGVQDELLKFDAMEEINEEFEKNIKTNLLARGFSVSQVLNNRGLIGATIEETIDEMKKHHESANSEKKYTEEDMFNCFQESRITNAMIGFKHIDFAQYLNSLEK
jgi:hypothetical protein